MRLASPREWYWSLEALLRLLQTHAKVRRMTYVRGRPADVPLSAAGRHQAALLGLAVARACRICPLPSHCIHRALTLYAMLQARGIACDLRLGTRELAGDFTAHAWVQCGGVPIPMGTGTPADYLPFDDVVRPEYRLTMPTSSH